MAKQIEGVYDKLIECAKAEFLEKGFKDASLRTIAKNAHTSTNSIYVRFGDKAGLFDALVKPHYETVMNRYKIYKNSDRVSELACRYTAYQHRKTIR